MRLRIAPVSAFFAALLAIIANLAYDTARTQSGPWFDGSVSLDAYSTFLLVSTLLALALAAMATGRIGRIDESFLTLQEVREALRGGTGVFGGLRPSAIYGDESIDAALHSELEGPEAPPSNAVTAGSSVEAVVRLLEKAEAQAVPRSETVALAELRLHRQLLHRLRRRVWLTVAAPLSIALAFAAICATMLLGALGFLQYNYTLNTALLLFMGYGWAPLLAWSVAALALMPSTSGQSAP